MSVGPDLRDRVVSALILAPLALAATFLGGVAFALFWLIAGFAVLYEVGSVVRLPRLTAYLALGGFTLSAATACLLLGLPLYGFGILLLGTVLCAAVSGQARWGAAGVVCGALACLPIIALRGDTGLGGLAVVFLFAVVWGTDVGAYFTGRAIGGPKLSPRLSPNKTWSGAVGGAVVGTLAGSGLVMACGLAFSPVLVGIGILISVVSQCGDLSESAFKRAFGVKDTGAFIPGHGGVLDRLDGFMAAALLALLIGLFRVVEMPASGLLLW